MAFSWSYGRRDFRAPRRQAAWEKLLFRRLNAAGLEAAISISERNGLVFGLSAFNRHATICRNTPDGIPDGMLVLPGKVTS
jgi:hypothetical protein